MNVRTKQFDQAPAHESPAPRIRVGWLIRVSGLTAALAVLAAAMMIILWWVPLMPRSVRRGLTEGLLRAVLVGYGGLFFLSLVATPLMAFALFRSRPCGEAGRCLHAGY